MMSCNKHVLYVADSYNGNWALKKIAQIVQKETTKTTEKFVIVVGDRLAIVTVRINSTISQA